MVSSIVIVVLAVCLIGLLSYTLAKFAFIKDDQRETRHKHYIQVSQFLTEYGLKMIPAILVDLAVGDYSGAYEQIKFFVKLLERDPKSVAAEFDKVFERVLAVKLTSPESLSHIKALIAAAEQGTDTSAPSATGATA